MKKRLISLMLALCLLVGATPVAQGGYALIAQKEIAARAAKAAEAAQELYELGLFKGTGKNPDGSPSFSLDRAPTRHEAVTMLVRLLGKEEEAKAGEWATPFTDVADWAKPYVGYAYANGLTSGTSKTTYSGEKTVTASQYLTFVLRALGYQSGTDFKWDAAWELSDEIGLTNGEYNAETTEFLRGDVAIISLSALSCEKKADIFASIPAETATQRANYEKMMVKWSRCQLQGASKGLTLTWDQARALVGQDIETVKRYVCSLEDCLYYLCAAGYSQISGDLTYSSGGITWHFNPSPQVSFARNKGNCGGNAALTAYLLEGDYDEVGYACYRGKVGDGGHVVNYLRDGSNYYVFDVNQFAGNYSKGIALQHGADLNKCVKRLFSIGATTQRRHPAMMAYTYSGCYDGDAPMGWPSGPKSYIIEGYAENVNIVYETPEEGYVYEFITVDQSVLDRIEAIRNQ